MWYHGTSAMNEIINNGFDLNIMNHGRRFGNGVYFANIKEKVSHYGSEVIAAEIDNTNILSMTIAEINKIIDRLIMRYSNNFADYISEYIKGMGFNALSVEYSDGEKELIVYNESIIKINQQ